MVYVAILLALVVDAAFRLLAPVGLGFDVAPPSLTLVTALYVGFRAKRSSQLGYAVLLGALVGGLSSRGMAHFAFLYGVSAYLAWRIRRYLPPDAMIAYAIASFFCGMIYAAFALVIAVMTVDGSVGAGFGRSLLEVLFSAMTAPLVFSLWDQSRMFRKALGGRDYEFA